MRCFGWFPGNKLESDELVDPLGPTLDVGALTPFPFEVGHPVPIDGVGERLPHQLPVPVTPFPDPAASLSDDWYSMPTSDEVGAGVGVVSHPGIDDPVQTPGRAPLAVFTAFDPRREMPLPLAEGVGVPPEMPPAAALNVDVLDEHGVRHG